MGRPRDIWSAGPAEQKWNPTQLMHRERVALLGRAPAHVAKLEREGQGPGTRVQRECTPEQHRVQEPGVGLVGWSWGLSACAGTRVSGSDLCRAPCTDPGPPPGPLCLPAPGPGPGGVAVTWGEGRPSLRVNSLCPQAPELGRGLGSWLEGGFPKGRMHPGDGAQGEMTDHTRGATRRKGRTRRKNEPWRVHGPQEALAVMAQKGVVWHTGRCGFSKT